MAGVVPLAAVVNYWYPSAFASATGRSGSEAIVQGCNTLPRRTRYFALCSEFQPLASSFLGTWYGGRGVVALQIVYGVVLRITVRSSYTPWTPGPTRITAVLYRNAPISQRPT